MQISKKLNILHKDLIIAREDGKPLALTEATRVGDVPYFTDGAIIKVASKNPKKQPLHSGIKASDIE